MSLRRTGMLLAACVVAAALAPGHAVAAQSPAEALLDCARREVPLAKEQAVACLQRAAGIPAPAVTGAAMTPVTAGSRACVAVPLLDDRCEAWAQSYAHPGNTGAGSLGDRPRDLVADPRGELVYMIGLSEDGGSSDYLTLALRADTGEVAWTARWDGLGTDDRPWQAAISPGGDRLFVTGTRDFANGFADQATVAYDARTGEELWSRRVARSEDDWGVDVVASPDGSRVYVSALGAASGSGRDFKVTAYRASDGEVMWTSAHGTSRADQVASMSVSPDGRKLFLVGDTGEEAGAGIDYLTMALDTGMPEGEEDRAEHAGELLWTARWDVGFLDWPFAVEASPDGDRVFVTGLVEADTPQPSLVVNLDFGTAAYDADTGAQLWTSRYHSDVGGPNGAFDLAVSPDGSSVFATGQITGLGTYMDLDFGTVAIDAATGQQRWASRYQVPGQMFEFGQSIGVSPNGSRVYTSGWASADAFLGSVWHGDSATIAYDAATGTQAWAARYSNSPPFTTYGMRLAVGPSGLVFTTGTLFYFATTTGNPADVSVLAYDP